MEEKKLDVKSIIGFVLIFGILLWMMYNNTPTPEELEAQKQEEAAKAAADKKAEAEKEKETLVTTPEDFSNVPANDSLQQVALQNKLGAFAYAASLPSAKGGETSVENEVLALKFNTIGGHLSEVKLKAFVNYDKEPIYIVKDGNSNFNINLATTNNRTFNTQDLPFQPSVTKNGDNTIVSMKLKVSETKYLEYRYELKPCLLYTSDAADE